jgi:hypothetical protein
MASAATPTPTPTPTITPTPTPTITSTPNGGCSYYTHIRRASEGGGGTEVFIDTTVGTSTLNGTCATSNNSPERVYEWIPEVSGIATISTCSISNTNYDTLIYVRRGNNCPTSTEMSCNDDTSSCATSEPNDHHGSKIVMSVEVGFVYWIVVDGYNGANGTYELTLVPPVSPTPTPTLTPTPTTTTTATPTVTVTPTPTLTPTPTVTVTASPTATLTQVATPTPTLTPTPTATCTPAVIANFNNNSCDGTVTDSTTGLTWEQKTVAGSGGLHDVSNTYTWSSAGNLPNGSVFTQFIAGLNAANFAGHADWRLPSATGYNGPYIGAKELDSIAPTPFPCSVHPCIGAIFGSTQAAPYWTGTAYDLSPLVAWYLGFYDNAPGIADKQFSFPARAVRP